MLDYTLSEKPDGEEEPIKSTYSDYLDPEERRGLLPDPMMRDLIPGPGKSIPGASK